MTYTDDLLITACRVHAESVNPRKPIDEQTIALLARILRLALTCIEKGAGVVTLNQLLDHVHLPIIQPAAPNRFNTTEPATDAQARITRALEYLKDPRTDRHHDGDMVLAILTAGLEPAYFQVDNTPANLHPDTTLNIDYNLPPQA